MFNKGDKIIVRHKDKNGQSQFSWVTRVLDTEGDTCHIYEAMPNGYVSRNRNHILVSNKDNFYWEYEIFKEGDKDVYSW